LDKYQKVCTKKVDVLEVDLWEEGVLRYDLSHVEAKMKLINGSDDSKDADCFAPVAQMAEQLVKADVLVVASPMWNYSCPHVLKHYIDIVIQPGLTFTQHENSGPQPLRGGRQLVLVTSTGGDYSAGTLMAKNDFLRPYLQTIFSMVGFDGPMHEVYIKNAAHEDRSELQHRAAEDATAAAVALSRRL
jgi:FMN-dependent NADH-azoreductase